MISPGAQQPDARGKLEARVPEYRFGLVLALLFTTFIFMASGPTGEWVPFVTVVLQGATLLAALSASGARRRLWRIAVVVVILGLLSAVSIWISSSDKGEGVLFLLNVLLVAAAPVVIAQSLVRRRVIDLRTVLGALCIYVLLGMLWAFAFASIGDLGSKPFFVQKTTATLANYLYFSFVTLTTVGYGDLTAAGGLGQAVAVVEALLGQLYLVTVVALLVSNLGRRAVKQDTSP